MGKMTAFFLGLFILGMLFTGLGEGNGGIVATKLTSAMGIGDTTVNVTSTTNFLDTDYIYIGDEKILYAGTTATTFTGCTRGVSGTTAVAHANSSMVYNAESNIMNSALNMNITAVTANSGLFGVIQIPWKFLTYSLPNLVQMNFSFFQGDMAILGYMFMACACGFAVSLALAFLYVAAGIIKIF